MPFDLVLEQPPPFATRGVLSHARRRTLQKAISDNLITQAASLRGSAVTDERVRTAEHIHINASGLVEDLKHDWLAAPILELFDVIAEVASIDLRDDAAVGLA